MIAALTQTPPRMTIGNFETGQTLSAQFNPDELPEKLQVEYQKLKPLGFSSRPLQYNGTDNLTYDLNLVLDGMSTRGIQLASGQPPPGAPVGPTGPNAVMAARNFLFSLCYPRRAASLDVQSGSPPKTLISWPDVFLVLGRVTAVNGKMKRWNANGELTLYEVQLTFEESAESRIYSEDLIANGTFRVPEEG